MVIAKAAQAAPDVLGAPETAIPVLVAGGVCVVMAAQVVVDAVAVVVAPATVVMPARVVRPVRMSVTSHAMLTAKTIARAPALMVVLILLL